MTIVVQDVVDRVRFLLGGATEEVISTQIITDIANSCIAEIGDEDEKFCEVVYCTLIDTLRYLIRQNQMNSGITGNQRKRKEVNGKRTIEVEFGDSSDVVADGWQQMYEDYLENPDWVCKDLGKDNGTALVLIGGVSQTEYNRVNNTVDSRNGYHLSPQRNYNSKTVQQVRRRRTTRSRWC